jgi:hypothetical protein
MYATSMKADCAIKCKTYFYHGSINTEKSINTAAAEDNNPWRYRL